MINFFNRRCLAESPVAQRLRDSPGGAPTVGGVEAFRHSMRMNKRPYSLSPHPIDRSIYEAKTARCFVRVKRSA